MNWIVPAALLALVVTIWGNTLDNGFIFAARPPMAGNVRIERTPDLNDVLGPAMQGNHPVRALTFALDHAIAGPRPWIYHLSNLVFHLITAWLVFLVVSRLTRRTRLGAVASLLFCVHPVQTGAVTCISGRGEILGAMFFLLGFYLFLSARVRGARWTDLLLLLAFALGLLSAKNAATLPVICLGFAMIEYYRARARRPGVGPFRGVIVAAGRAIRRRFPLYAGFTVLAAAYLTWRPLAGIPAGPEDAASGLGLATATADLQLAARSLMRLVWPASPGWGEAALAVSGSPGVAAAVLVSSATAVAALVAVALVRVRTRPAIAFGILWFFITLLPCSRVFSAPDSAVESHLYLPIVGMILVATTGYRALESRAGQTVSSAILIVITALFAGRTILRNREITVPEDTRGVERMEHRGEFRNPGIGD